MDHAPIKQARGRSDMLRPLLCEIETQLADGRAICLRTIRPSDEARIRDGIAELSDRSRYFRFFSAFREPPESIVKQLSAVDGHDHIGWGAILLDGAGNPPIAAAHAIRSEDDPATGELAIAVLDEYQGYGVARLVIAALLTDCVREGLHALEMQMLGENRAAANLALALGGQRKMVPDGVEHYILDVTEALERLRKDEDLPTIAHILAQLG